MVVGMDVLPELADEVFLDDAVFFAVGFSDGLFLTITAGFGDSCQFVAFEFAEASAGQGLADEGAFEDAFVA